MNTCVRCHVVILPDDGRTLCHYCRLSVDGPERWCPFCGEWWPDDAEFWRPRRGLSRCCECWRMYYRARWARYYEAHPDLCRQRARAYRERRRAA